MNIIRLAYHTLKHMDSLAIFLNIANLVVLGLSIFLISYSLRGKVINKKVFPLIGFSIIFLSKLHLILFNVELDFDETIHLVQAQGVLQNGYVYWRDMASGSSGPINTYIIVLFGWLINRTDWVTVHLVYTFFTALNWILYYFIILRFNIFTQKQLQLLSITSILFFATLQNDYLLNFHTELIGITLLMVSLLLFASIKNETNRSINFKLIIVGVLFFLSFLSKLQLVPLIVLIGFGMVLLKQEKWLSTAILICTGFALSFILFYSIAIYFDFSAKFYFYYIDRNLNYSSGGLINNFLTFISKTSLSLSQIKETGLLYFLVLFILTLLITLLVKAKSLFSANRIYYLLVWGVILTVFFSIFKSGKNYPHYFYLFFYSIFFLFAYLNYHIKKFELALKTLLPLLFLVGLYNQIMGFKKEAHYFKEQVYYPFKGISEYNYSIRSDVQMGRLIKIKLKESNILPKNAKMTVWGNDISIHIYSSVSSATPDAHIDYIANMSPESSEKTYKYYLQSFLKNKPEVFVLVKNRSSSFYKKREMVKQVDEKYKSFFENETYNLFIRKEIL